MNKNQQLYPVGVLGAGTMGAGIAQVAAASGHTVFLQDMKNEALESARDRIGTNLNKQVDKAKIDRTEAKAILNRINSCSDLRSFGDCRLVIEAVVEDLQVKQAAFRDLEQSVSTDCILATNTSSLSIASFGSAINEPQRFLGLHFFNPAFLMPLVEVIPGIATNTETINEARNVLHSWGKTTVIAKDTPGFIVNRIARPFYGEALRIFEEGIADVATIDWAMKEIGGFRMGPFELMDYIGNDINYKVTETVFEAFFYDPRFKPSFTQKRMIEYGFLGRKTGKGFYDYASGAVKPEPKKDRELGKSVTNRILAMLINEAADALFLNVATAEDIDMAMTKGVNYPKGLLAWADEIGLPVVLERLQNLQEYYGEDRYRPNPLIKKMAANDLKFYS